MSSSASEWIPLGEGSDTTYYRKFLLYDMRWDDVDLQEYLVSAAPFGGPIALTRDPKKLVMLSERTKPEIFIYTATGENLGHIEWKYSAIVNIGWTNSEELVVVAVDGTAVLYNILGVFERSFCFTEVSRIIMANIYQSGVVVLSDTYDLYYADDLDDPVVKKLPSSEIYEPPLAMEVVAPDNTKDHILEVYLSPTSTDEELGGTLILVTPKGTIDLDMTTVPFTRVAASNDGNLFATFNMQGRLQVCYADFKKSLCDVDTKCRKPPRQLCWCGKDAVLCMWSPDQIGGKGDPESLLMMVGPNGQCETFNYEGAIHIISEIDGSRIISKAFHDMLQRVPTPIVDIFNIGSTTAPALLYDAWEGYESKSASSVRNVRSIGADLSTAVESCIDAAGHEFEIPPQRKLLKAASFGKCFCENFDAQRFVDACKNLRVLNEVRHYKVGIPLTVPQYDALTLDVLIDRLINRHLHLLAYKICLYLDRKRGIEKVLVHWACARVASSASDAVIRESIVSKLEQCKGISYAQVACTAYHNGRKNLAIMLLEHEPSSSQQVRLLIQPMGEEKMALDKALQSGDSELGYWVVLHMKRTMNQTDFFRILSSSPQARDLALCYCQEQDSVLLEQFHLATGSHHLAAHSAIRHYFDTKDIREKDQLLRKAKEWMTTKGRTADAKILEEQSALLKVQEELEKSTGKPNFLGLSVTDTIYLAIVNREAKRAGKLQKDFAVPNKRYWWITLKAFCAISDWEALAQWAKEKSPIGYRPFVEECLKYNQPAQAQKYIPKCSDVSDRVELYCRIGKFQDAIQDAFADKNAELLQQVYRMTSSQDQKNQIQNMIQSLQ